MSSEVYKLFKKYTSLRFKTKCRVLGLNYMTEALMLGAIQLNPSDYWNIYRRKILTLTEDDNSPYLPDILKADAVANAKYYNKEET